MQNLKPRSLILGPPRSACPIRLSLDGGRRDAAVNGV